MDLNKKKWVRRLRRRRHIRKKLAGTAQRPRLTVYRSLKHIYCQAIDDHSGETIVSASSASPEIRAEIGSDGRNRKGAELVGVLLARKVREKGIRAVVFDRNGYRFHGRVAALAGAVRKEGIEV
ncbi:MAG: 50S ribosomal protein L18 [Planctomycetota bacterium]